MAQEAPAFRSMIFPDAPEFANPDNMVRAIEEYCVRTGQPVPQTQGEFTRCIYESLALRYRQVFELLRGFAPFPLKVLHVIGGGSRNEFLNQMTADSLGVPVVAGPVECTAAGNIMVQAQAAGEVQGLQDIRATIAACTPTNRYEPDAAASATFADAYARFLEVTAC